MPTARAGKREDKTWSALMGIWSQCSTDCGPQAACPTKVWFRICLLSMAVAVICSMDRSAMSTAIIPMSKQHGWSDSVKGAVSSSFNVGHTVTNLLGGAMATMISPKKVLTYGVIVWSLFTILTPPAAHWLNLLLFVRMVMGLGEGCAYPTLQAVIKGWVPPDKRSRALGLIYSGHQVGAILSLLISPFIIQAAGVPMLFYVFGSLGFLWLALWGPLVPPMPPLAASSNRTGVQLEARRSSECGEMLISHSSNSGGTSARAGASPRLHGDSHDGAAGSPAVARGHAHSADKEAGEKLLDGSLGSGAEQEWKVVGGKDHGHAAHALPLPSVSNLFGFRDLPWRSFLSNRCFWAILVAHSTFGLGYNICIAWLPTYYSQQFGLDVKHSSLMSVLPWLVMALGTNASGWLADTLINARVMSTTKTRKMLQLIGNLGPGLCLFYLGLVPQKGYLLEALTLLTMCMATLGFQAGGFASNHTDISTKYASVLFGITNAGSSVSGTIFVYITGVILEKTGSWALVFQTVAIANFITAFIYTTFATSEVQFE